MRKTHRFESIKTAICKKCKRKDFIEEKCKDDGCIFIQTRSIPCKCAEKHRKQLIKDANKIDDYKRSTWRGMK